MQYICQIWQFTLVKMHYKSDFFDILIKRIFTAVRFDSYLCLHRKKCTIKWIGYNFDYFRLFQAVKFHRYATTRLSKCIIKVISLNLLFFGSLIWQLHVFKFVKTHYKSNSSKFQLAAVKFDASLHLSKCIIKVIHRNLEYQLVFCCQIW